MHGLLGYLSTRPIPPRGQLPFASTLVVASGTLGGPDCWPGESPADRPAERRDDHLAEPPLLDGRPNKRRRNFGAEPPLLDHRHRRPSERRRDFRAEPPLHDGATSGRPRERRGDFRAEAPLMLDRRPHNDRRPGDRGAHWGDATFWLKRPTLTPPPLRSSEPTLESTLPQSASVGADEGDSPESGDRSPSRAPPPPGIAMALDVARGGRVRRGGCVPRWSVLGIVESARASSARCQVASELSSKSGMIFGDSTHCPKRRCSRHGGGHGSEMERSRTSDMSWGAVSALTKRGGSIPRPNDPPRVGRWDVHRLPGGAVHPRLRTLQPLLEWLGVEGVLLGREKRDHLDHRLLERRQDNFPKVVARAVLLVLVVFVLVGAAARVVGVIVLLRLVLSLVFLTLPERLQHADLHRIHIPRRRHLQ
eukprot:CAMPEP_0180353918 /NCGR_PEP_ID=MMETSP0989-20121125/7913_1 /TAXON_ID=697907 /ORGANISM="non described non described, Strain CCMP2293" /LENGTH=420 /DNA_ID=CAMNT_0022343649 /DNA_START=259 /DNA_END=1519 /DNA_ORIENTATION=-